MAGLQAQPALTPALSQDERDAQDVRWMQAFCNGDGAAFRHLYLRYFAEVHRFCMRMVQSPAAAEELAQDTFMNLHRYREGYERRARFRTYLYTIAHRLCLNELRKPCHRGPAPLSQSTVGPDGHSPFERLSDGAVPADMVVAERERLQRVAAVLQQMPERQRAATVLVRLQGLSVAEAGRCLGCSDRAVKLLLHRARAFIVKQLKGPARTTGSIASGGAKGGP